MKSILSIIFFLLLLITSSLLAQNGADSEPPARVQVNFNARYPEKEESAQWQQTEEGYQATFKDRQQEVLSEFGENGRWLRSKTQLQESDLPADARTYIRENYESYNYQEGYRYENEKGIRYEVNLNSQNKHYRLKFDKAGGFVEENEL